MGDYEPIRRLVAPNRLQLYTSGIEFSPTKKTNVRAEVALSSFDKNRLSNLSDGGQCGGGSDDGGAACGEFWEKEGQHF